MYTGSPDENQRVLDDVNALLPKELLREKIKRAEALVSDYLDAKSEMRKTIKRLRVANKSGRSKLFPQLIGYAVYTDNIIDSFKKEFFVNDSATSFYSDFVLVIRDIGVQCRIETTEESKITLHVDAYDLRRRSMRA